MTKGQCVTVKTLWFVITTTNTYQVQQVEHKMFNPVLDHS